MESLLQLIANSRCSIFEPVPSVFSRLLNPAPGILSCLSQPCPNFFNMRIHNCPHVHDRSRVQIHADLGLSLDLFVNIIPEIMPSADDAIIPLVARRIMTIHRIIPTIRKQVVGANRADLAEHSIGIDEPTPLRLVVAAAEVVQTGLVIVDVATIAEGIQLAQRASLGAANGQQSTPRVVTVCYNSRAGVVKDGSGQSTWIPGGMVSPAALFSLRGLRNFPPAVNVSCLEMQRRKQS